MSTTVVNGYVGVPYYFKVCCDRAAVGRRSEGYFDPGYELARQLNKLKPDELSAAEWGGEVARLSALVNGDDEKSNAQQVADWFEQWYPACMSFIPRQRSDVEQFIAGVYAAFAKGNAGVE